MHSFFGFIEKKYHRILEVLLHVSDNVVSELRAFNFGGVVHETGKIISDPLG